MMVKPKSNHCGWACATPTITVPPDPLPAGPAVSLLDQFADALSEHVDDDDIRAGRGTALDPGGDINGASAAVRVPGGIGQSFFDRICKRLGPQAQ